MAGRQRGGQTHGPVRVVYRPASPARGDPQAAALSAIALARIERLCARLIERGVRREDPTGAPLGAPATAPRMALVPASGPLSLPRVDASRDRAARERTAPMVVARGRGAVSQADAARVREQLSQAVGHAPADAAHTAAPATGTRSEPGEHVGALADEVIRRIDQRIAAHRERFGRA